MSHARPLLAVRRSVREPARAERIGWFVLAALACVAAHEATYQLVYPDQRSYRAAMTMMGHDRYWLVLSSMLALAALALIAVAAVQLRRLRMEAGTTPILSADEPAGIATYLRLVAQTWLRLAAAGVVLYTFQENLEAVAAGAPVGGLDVILGHGLLPLVVLLAAVTLMAVVVALVRWRRRVLLGRLSATSITWVRDTAPRRRRGQASPAVLRYLMGAWVSRAPPRRAVLIAL
jgi:hypothetical protein